MSQSTTPKPRRTGRLETSALFGGSALLVIAAFALAAQFIQPAPPRHISIAAGQRDGAYYHFAERYRKALARHGIELTVIETDGSLENLRLLLREQDPADLALVQGGVASDQQREQLSGLGSLFYEPLWLLTPDGSPSRPLNQLTGARIGIGPVGSGTRRLALRLLKANGIDPGNSDLIEQSAEQSAEALAAGRLDLAFVVGAPDSPLIRKLTRGGGVQLQDLPRADAYARRDRTVTALTLPAGTLDLADDVPRSDLSLIAATANLVTRPDIHPALVDLLVEAAREVHGGGSLLSAPGAFPTPAHSDFPLDADAERNYEHGPPLLQRYLPFWAATWIDRTKVMLLPLLALMLPLVKILPPVYQWRVRRRILRWYVQLRRIDLELETGEAGPADVAGLRARLTHIESEAAHTDVPLGYSDQLYNLRLHIRLLEQKLEGVGGDAEHP
jgi:TRAP transporter TAXI family solute receptor